MLLIHGKFKYYSQYYLFDKLFGRQVIITVGWKQSTVCTPGCDGVMVCPTRDNKPESRKQVFIINLHQNQGH